MSKHWLHAIATHLESGTRIYQSQFGARDFITAIQNFGFVFFTWALSFQMNAPIFCTSIWNAQSQQFQVGFLFVEVTHRLTFFSQIKGKQMSVHLCISYRENSHVYHLRKERKKETVYLAIYCYFFFASCWINSNCMHWIVMIPFRSIVVG